MRTSICHSLVAACALVLTASLAAQQPQPRVQPQPEQPRVQPAQRAQPGQPAQGAQRPGLGDPQLAAWLMVDNQNEVELARLAQDKSQHQQVKRFAEQMVDEHSAFLKKLQLYAQASPQRPGTQRREEGATQRPATDPTLREGDPNRDPLGARLDERPDANRTNPRDANRTDPNRPDPNRQDARTGQQRGDRPVAAAGAQGALVALKRELGQQCLQSARKELQSKEGAEFDQCFMGMQIAKHMQAIDTMTVFKNHASQELAQVLDEGIRTAQTHLEHAKTIIKALESPRRAGAE